jgi:hypothetical protein
MILSVFLLRVRVLRIDLSYPLVCARQREVEHAVEVLLLVIGHRFRNHIVRPV